MIFATSCIENQKVVIEKPFVDLKGRYETQSSPIDATPTELRVKITGEVKISHLGKSTLLAFTTVNLTPPPPFNLSATSTMVAANGDEIYTEATGTLMPVGNNKREITIYHTIVGGTGRFRNAKGSLIGTGENDVNTGLGYIDIEGEISY